MHRTTARAFAAAALLSIFGCAGASAQHSSTFTYQGSLQHQGEPYTGTADFAFRLWNAETGGQLASGLVYGDGVEVTDGLFQIPLDFGAEALRDDRWMVISVRTPAGHGPDDQRPYTELPGRHRVSLSPYSVQTRGIFVNEAGDRVGVGTTDPQATLHVAGEVRADEGVRFPGGGGIRDMFIAGPYHIDPPALVANGWVGYLRSVPGAQIGDFVTATHTPILQDCFIKTEVTGSNTVTIFVHNLKGVTHDPLPLDVSLLVFRR